MNALEKFSKDAARRYLQSAVFVDDQIFDKNTGMPAASVEILPQRKRIFRTPAKPPNTSGANGAIQIEQPYHPKDLVSSFAREGITCALYEPRDGFSTDSSSEIFKLCERPDIIILDWDFFGDTGSSALNLIVSLVTQGTKEFPHHARLISIYTADQSLVAVANKLASRLKSEGLEATPEGAQCRIKSGATRLIVHGKPLDRFGDEDVKFTVKESVLATTLIDEFVSMNAGILPAYALNGLAAIRRNSRRILERFHGDLDGPFLLHREFLSTSEEAFDQLPDLLAEEIRAVIEDERLSAAETKRIATAALRSGHVVQQDKDLLAGLKSKPSDRKKIAKKLIENNQAPNRYLRFAGLFSSRTQYLSAQRKLTFGTVVRCRPKHSRSEWKYAVCLVPECDSLRMNTDVVKFPFWTIEVEEYNSKETKNGMVLASGDNTYISLSAGGKAGEKVWTDTFSVDPKTRTVLAARSNKLYKFVGSAKTIEWVGQLKPLHAHRIAHEITGALSRIGLNEAEWLRLLCHRG